MWYNDQPPPDDDAPLFRWSDAFMLWSEIELDLHDTFGIDAESGILRRRTWRWLEARIADLASSPNSRLSHALAATVRG